MLFRRKAKEAGANFRSDEILPMRIFALAKFRQSEISLLWNANFCQDDRGIWNSRALELNLVVSFHPMFAKIKEIGEFRFIFARHHYKEGGGGVDGTPPKTLICCSVSKRFCLQWKAFDLRNKMRYILWVVTLPKACDVTNYSRHLGR